MEQSQIRMVFGKAGFECKKIIFCKEGYRCQIKPYIMFSNAKTDLITFEGFAIRDVLFCKEKISLLLVPKNRKEFVDFVGRYVDTYLPNEPESKAVQRAVEQLESNLKALNDPQALAQLEQFI